MNLKIIYFLFKFPLLQIPLTVQFTLSTGRLTNYINSKMTNGNSRRKLRFESYYYEINALLFNHNIAYKSCKLRYQVYFVD